MKMTTEKLITDLEHQYTEYSISERFHNATSIEQKRKALDSSLWPEAWKKAYFKSYPRLNSISLSHKFAKNMRLPLEQALKKRSSTRKFAQKVLSEKDLSTLLYYSAGIKEVKNNNWDLARRFYPSGGARYPLEVYIVLFGKSEVEKGIYHYNVKHHALELLKARDYLKELQSGLDIPWVSEASMAIFFTAVWGRNQMKYGDRGYRLVMAETGHLGQNFYLVANTLGLGCCALGGYADRIINTLLEVDGVHESVVYTLIVGTP